MSSEQTSAHPRSLRERIAVIRQNSATLRKRVTGTVGRSGLGWKGESARQELAASLRVHFAQTDGDGKGDVAHTNQIKSHECDDGDTDKTKGDHKQRDQDKGCERSDSMEPLKDAVVQEDGKTSYAGWHSLNSGMMRKKKLEELQGMYSSGGRFATIEPDKGRALQDVSSFADDVGDENGMTFSSHHLGDGDNPGLSSNPHPENDYLIPDHAFPSTLDLVRNKPEELYRDYSYAENQYPSGPYPSSPPTSHPQPPSSPSRAPSSRSPIAPSPVPSKFSVWPSTRAISPIAPFPANQDCSSPATISYSSTTAAIVSSSTVPFRSPSLSARPDLQYSNSNSAEKGGKRWNKDGGGERDDDCDIEYPPNHPLYGLDTLQRRSYWDELSSYRSNSPRLALKNAPLALQQDSRGRDSPDSWSQVQFGLLGSAAQSYRETLAADIERTFFEILGPEARILVRDMMNAMSEPTTRSMGVVSEEALNVAVPIEVEQEGRSKKTSGAGKLCQSLTCRSGATSPDGPARSVDPELQSADVAAMPKKFGMTYLTRKMRSDPAMWKKYKDKQRKIREATRDEVIAASGENARHDAGTERQNIELQPMPQSSPQELETPISKSGVETPKSDAHSDVAPPVQLSKAIQREPESIISSSPVADLPSLPGPSDPSPAPREPARERAITRIRAASQPPQSAQPKSESSRSSLSERLRATRLEDLRLQSETAQEIRELMLDLDRDRSQSLSKATGSRHRPTLSELPGGFTSTSSTESRSQRSKSPRGALERHFQTLQEANEEARLRGQTSLRSQSSNLTLPRSYKAPATHSYAPLPQSRASTSVTEDTNAEDDEVVSAQSSTTAVDNTRYERQKDDGEKEYTTPRDAELSTQREES